jgi:hypothetical protein
VKNRISPNSRVRAQLYAQWLDAFIFWGAAALYLVVMWAYLSAWAITATMPARTIQVAVTEPFDEAVTRRYISP